MGVHYYFTLIILPVAAYLIGSIPFGVIITRLFCNKDIRLEGSRNIGATNVRRIAGTIPAILTLTGDVLKGTIPVGFAIFLTGIHSNFGQMYVSFIAICSFLGHLYPIYFKFKNGGKGVATAGGCFLAISPLSVFISILVFILFVCMTSRASVGSLAGSVLLPISVWKSTGSVILTSCAVIVMVLIIFRHQENIKRLIAGTESKI